MSEWLALVQQEVFYKAHLNFTQTSIDVQRWLSTCSLPCRQADFCNNQGEIKATSVLQSHSISDRKKWDMSLIKICSREKFVYLHTSKEIHSIIQESAAVTRGTSALWEAKQDIHEEGNSFYINSYFVSQKENAHCKPLCYRVAQIWDPFFFHMAQKTSLMLRITRGHQSSSKGAPSFHER